MFNSRSHSFPVPYVVLLLLSSFLLFGFTSSAMASAVLTAPASGCSVSYDDDFIYVIKAPNFSLSYPNNNVALSTSSSSDSILSKNFAPYYYTNPVKSFAWNTSECSSFWLSRPTNACMLNINSSFYYIPTKPVSVDIPQSGSSTDTGSLSSVVSLDESTTASIHSIDHKINYLYAAGIFVIALCAGVLVLFILWRVLAIWFEF